MDSKAVELALNRTERGLQVACEQFENSGSNNVVTLPAVKRDSTVQETAAIGRNQRGGKSMRELVNVARRRSPIKQTTKKQQLPPPPPPAPNSLSPGQLVQAQHIANLMSKPSHPLTQQLLSSYYGLPGGPAPSLATTVVAGGRKEARLLPQGQLVTGPTTSHLTTLPRANRRDALVRCDLNTVYLSSIWGVYLPRPQATPTFQCCTQNIERWEWPENEARCI